MAAYRKRVDEQINQGTPPDVQCRFCGKSQRDPRSRDERAQHYQVLIACEQCGNEFAAISRN
jgi:hypothetical protein